MGLCVNIGSVELRAGGDLSIQEAPFVKHITSIPQPWSYEIHFCKPFSTQEVLS